jgi:hypothetical protein
MISIDLKRYYISAKLVGQHVVVHLDAPARCMQRPWKSHQWRAVAPCEPLMRTLQVVVFHESLTDQTRLLQVSRPIQGKTLLLRGSIVAFDERIVLGMVSSTDVDLNAQASRHRRTRAAGKSLPGFPAHPAWVAIQGDTLRSTILG